MSGETAIKNKDEASETAASFGRLYETIRTLRAPDGCPWDRDQTPLSMRRDLIEEVFEAVDAVTQQDAPHAKEELGDVVLNASLTAYMYEQSGDFTVADMLDELTEKLIRRHPHVFKQSEGSACMTGEVRTSSEVISQWDKIKETVEGRKGAASILDEVPAGFPPLLRAYKMQKKAGKKGFDWKTIEPVAAKVQEEFSEVREAEEEVKTVRTASAGESAPLSVHSTPSADSAQLHLEEEFGDLLFAVVNYMRHLGVDPETAMDRANRKFYRRFSYVEQHMAEAGIPMDGEHLADEERLWNEAKRSGL
ncbi:MAG TPA: nucleoside triphosphate pyrophosphohydrolase [Treponema sp.]|nr:nucleoside triphosphate pyrophosphohydrolase [Treponema sp.]